MAQTRHEQAADFDLLIRGGTVVKRKEERMNTITRRELAQLDASATPTVSFELNGQPVTARAGETIIQVAQRNGIEVPHLCYKEGLETVGNCRACVVEIAGERVLAPSCCRAPANGMQACSC